MRLRFALGAWSNTHFDQALYPSRTPHAEHLPRYATLFDAVEADVLHHRDAEEGTLEEWVAQTPKGFTFLPKMNKKATHGERGAGDDNGPPDAAAAEAALDSLAPLEAAKKLGPVLLQFPASFERTTGWDHLVSLLALRSPGSFAVEFRHNSWFVPAVENLLEDFDAPLVWSTIPKAFAPPWRTASRGYVRFTGKHFNTRGRHITVEDRLDAILEIRSRLTQASWDECFVVVTNPFEGNAVDSLPRIAAALGDKAFAASCLREPAGPLFPDVLPMGVKRRPQA